MRIFKFSTPSCGQCAALEKRLKTEGIEHENIDCTSNEGSELADKFGINHVPTLVVLDGDKEVHRMNFGEAVSNIAALKVFSQQK